MFKSPPTVLEPQTASAMVKKARNFELCKRYDEGLKILSGIWNGTTDYPVVKNFSEKLKAEVLLVCGAYLSWLSYTNQTKESNLIARDWLTESNQIFLDAGLYRKSAEAQVEIGITYWREGASSEASVWLESAHLYLTEFDEIKIKLISTQIINFILERKIDEANDLVDKYENLINKFGSDRAKTDYYLNTGVLFQEQNCFEEALRRYFQTIVYAKICGNETYWAIAENNVAILYKIACSYNEALHYSIESEKHLKKLEDFGHLAGCYDSRAQIYLEMRQFEKALECADSSLEILEKGDEYGFIVESYWTKTRILIELQKKSEALDCFSTLIQIAVTRLSKAIADKYRKEFEDTFYLKSEIQTTNFIRRRKKRRVDSKPNLLYNGKSVILPNDIEIKSLVEVDCERLSYLGIHPESLAVCIDSDDENLPIYIYDFVEKDYYCGFPHFWIGLIGLHSDDDELLIVNQNCAQILGSIIGFCKFNDKTNSYEYYELKL